MYPVTRNVAAVPWRPNPVPTDPLAIPPIVVAVLVGRCIDVLMIPGRGPNNLMLVGLSNTMAVLSLVCESAR